MSLWTRHKTSRTLVLESANGQVWPEFLDHCGESNASRTLIVVKNERARKRILQAGRGGFESKDVMTREEVAKDRGEEKKETKSEKCTWDTVVWEEAHTFSAKEEPSPLFSRNSNSKKKEWRIAIVKKDTRVWPGWHHVTVPRPSHRVHAVEFEGRAEDEIARNHFWAVTVDGASRVATTTTKRRWTLGRLFGTTLMGGRDPVPAEPLSCSALAQRSPKLAFLLDWLTRESRDDAVVVASSFDQALGLLAGAFETLGISFTFEDDVFHSGMARVLLVSTVSSSSSSASPLAPRHVFFLNPDVRNEMKTLSDRWRNADHPPLVHHIVIKSEWSMDTMALLENASPPFPLYATARSRPKRSASPPTPCSPLPLSLSLSPPNPPNPLDPYDEASLYSSSSSAPSAPSILSPSSSSSPHPLEDLSMPSSSLESLPHPHHPLELSSSPPPPHCPPKNPLTPLEVSSSPDLSPSLESLEDKEVQERQDGQDGRGSPTHSTSSTLPMSPSGFFWNMEEEEEEEEMQDETEDEEGEEGEEGAWGLDPLCTLKGRTKFVDLSDRYAFDPMAKDSFEAASKEQGSPQGFGVSFRDFGSFLF